MKNAAKRKRHLVSRAERRARKTMESMSELFEPRQMSFTEFASYTNVAFKPAIVDMIFKLSPLMEALRGQR